MMQVVGPRDPDVLLPLLFPFSLSNMANLLLVFCGTEVIFEVLNLSYVSACAK